MKLQIPTSKHRLEHPNSKFQAPSLQVGSWDFGGSLDVGAWNLDVRPRRAFTLVELLTVIAIIGILAAVLLVVLSQAVAHARKTAAKLDVTQIANAIEQYDSMFGHMPVSSAVQQSGVNNVTYGGTYTSAATASNQFPPPSAP